MKDLNAKTISSYSFSKKNNEVRVELVQLNPEKRIDIREWSRFTETDELKPTKKGISIPVESISNLIELLKKIELDLKKK